jgi:hypothetical protein
MTMRLQQYLVSFKASRASLQSEQNTRPCTRQATVGLLHDLQRGSRSCLNVRSVTLAAMCKHQQHVKQLQQEPVAAHPSS